ncbi:MAG TPA: hypothetical protein VEY87_06885 [Gaiellaceae bacterium]|jgi:hypothetical protein|nr:hypothetical protein [Gaiellaceae bacterium]
MDTLVWVLLVVVVVALAAGAWFLLQRRRSEQLREGFGPEYERVVEETGDRREAERELKERRDRREELEVRTLPEPERARYAEEWRAVQGRFVDEPEAAVQEADRLVQQVMAVRGYPVADDFEHRAADVSVDYPDVVQNFREGHRLVQDHRQGSAGTEGLRQAMVHFRSLFEELLEEPGDEEGRR